MCPLSTGRRVSLHTRKGEALLATALSPIVSSILLRRHQLHLQPREAGRKPHAAHRGLADLDTACTRPKVSAMLSHPSKRSVDWTWTRRIGGRAVFFAVAQREDITFAVVSTEKTR